MRMLFEIDTKDYDINGTSFSRPSSRGIIIKNGKVAMVHSLKYEYYKFPGGGIEVQEDKVTALIREVMEETNIDIANTCYSKRYKIGIFDNPNRDERGRVITFLSTAVISGRTSGVAGDDAAELKWFSLRNLPHLAFDHGDMINMARKEQNF